MTQDPVNAILRRKALESRPYTSTQIAREIIDELGLEALHEWFEENMEAVLADHVRNTHKAMRSRVGHSITYAKRAEAVRAFQEDGNAEHLSIFETWRFSIPDEMGRREYKPLGKMTGRDHEFLADDYSGRAERNAMHAALHRAVAKVVGNKRTDEVLTERQFIELFQRHVPETEREAVNAGRFR